MAQQDSIQKSRIERLTGVGRDGQGPILLIGLGHGATHWTAAVFYLLLPFLSRSFDLNYAEAGLLASIFHLSATLANVGSGALVDLTGRRVPYQAGALAVGGAALLTFGLASSIWGLAALVAIVGITNNLWHPAAISFLSGRYPNQRGYALSIHALGANGGDAIAPVAIGVLLSFAAWPTATALATLPVFAVAVWLLIALLPKDRLEADGGTHQGGLAEYVAGLRRLVADRAVLGLCLSAGLRTMAQTGLLTFLPLFLADVLKADPLTLGLALAAMQGAGLLAAPVAGTLSDRIGRRRIVLGGLGASSVVILGLSAIGNLPLFVTGIAVLGFVLFAVRPVIHSWLMDLTPPGLSGSATSLLFGIQAGLSVVAPAVGGLLADSYGISAVFYMIGGLLLAANLALIVLPHRDPARLGNKG